MTKKTEFQKLLIAWVHLIGTNQQTADRLGVPLRTFEDWKAGRRVPAPHVIIAMVARLEPGKEKTK